MRLSKSPNRGSFVFGKLVITLCFVSIGYIVFQFFSGYWNSSKGGTLLTELFIKDRSQGDEQLKAVIKDEFSKQLGIALTDEQILIERPEDQSSVKITVPFEHRVNVPGTEVGFGLSFEAKAEEPTKVSNPFGK